MYLLLSEYLAKSRGSRICKCQDKILHQMVCFEEIWFTVFHWFLIRWRILVPLAGNWANFWLKKLNIIELTFFIVYNWEKILCSIYILFNFSQFDAYQRLVPTVYDVIWRNNHRVGVTSLWSHQTQQSSTSRVTKKSFLGHHVILPNTNLVFKRVKLPRESCYWQLTFHLWTFELIVDV